MRASSFGWRNRTRPKPSPRRMISRLNWGVSGPQGGGSAPWEACAVRVALTNAQIPKDMIRVHPESLLVRIAASFSSSPDIGSLLRTAVEPETEDASHSAESPHGLRRISQAFPRARYESVFGIAFSTPTPASFFARDEPFISQARRTPTRRSEDSGHSFSAASSQAISFSTARGWLPGPFQGARRRPSTPTLPFRPAAPLLYESERSQRGCHERKRRFKGTGGQARVWSGRSCSHNADRPRGSCR